MLRVWVHDCDRGRVSDGSRLALYQTLSNNKIISNVSALLLSFSGSNMCILLLFLSFCRFCSCVFRFALVGVL